MWFESDFVLVSGDFITELWAGRELRCSLTLPKSYVFTLQMMTKVITMILRPQVNLGGIVWHSWIFVCLFVHSIASLLVTPCQYWVGPPFAFRTLLRGILSTRCWKHSSEILVHIDMIATCSCCRFVGCTSTIQISCSTTSQRCSIGLRSGGCGGHWSTVNSLTCSGNQFEMFWAF